MKNNLVFCFIQLTSEEVVTAFVNRCRQVNPLLNAIIDERFKKAVEDARKVDEFLRNDEMNVSELEKQKPLLGVPVTIKESCKVKGTFAEIFVINCFVFE